MITIALFNNKGGVGKTTLLYHIAWMLQDLGIPTLAVDLDPQANLTSLFLTEDELLELWDTHDGADTIHGSIGPLLKGTGDVAAVPLHRASPRLHVLPGDLRLSLFEDALSDAWPRCHNGDEAAFRKMTAFHRAIAASAVGLTAAPQVALIDVGPNLGAINRASLISSDHVVFPVNADVFSLQGLRNLGPTLRGWRHTWQQLKPRVPDEVAAPSGDIHPLGYVLSQHNLFAGRVVKAYDRWAQRIPAEYASSVLEDQASSATLAQDPHALAILKHYRSLMALAQDARKPMFHLTAADGAIGAHLYAVQDCREDFEALTRTILTLVGVAPSA